MTGLGQPFRTGYEFGGYDPFGMGPPAPGPIVSRQEDPANYKKNEDAKKANTELADARKEQEEESEWLTGVADVFRGISKGLEKTKIFEPGAYDTRRPYTGYGLIDREERRRRPSKKTPSWVLPVAIIGGLGLVGLIVFAAASD